MQKRGSFDADATLTGGVLILLTGGYWVPMQANSQQWQVILEKHSIVWACSTWIQFPKPFSEGGYPTWIQDWTPAGAGRLVG
jgi:hypothetical protein